MSTITRIQEKHITSVKFNPEKKAYFYFNKGWKQKKFLGIVTKKAQEDFWTHGDPYTGYSWERKFTKKQVLNYIGKLRFEEETNTFTHLSNIIYTLSCGSTLTQYFDTEIEARGEFDRVTKSFKEINL